MGPSGDITPSRPYSQGSPSIRADDHRRSPPREPPNEDPILIERRTVPSTQALLVTMNDRREVFLGDLTVEAGRITAIGPNLPVPPGAEVIDARGLTLIPGLIQTHIHLVQTLFRGLADDLELLDWLKQRIWPL